MNIAKVNMLVGEDRAFGGNRLYVDLIPKSAFYKNLRDALPRRRWDALSRFVRNRESVCEACGEATPFEHRQAHERWSYEEDRGVQRVERLVSLCRMCHESTHFGLAVITGHEGRASAHLRAVNGWSNEQLTRHIHDAFALWRRRNSISWRQDFTIVTDLRV